VGEIFCIRPDRSCGLPTLLYRWYLVFFLGVKQPGCAVEHPPPFSAEVKERVKVYLYFFSGLSWQFIG
jgi:hypothetical protein